MEMDLSTLNKVVLQLIDENTTLIGKIEQLEKDIVELQEMIVILAGKISQK